MTLESVTATHHETTEGPLLNARLIATHLPHMTLLGSPLVIHTLRDFMPPGSDPLCEEPGTEVVFELRNPPMKVRIRSWAQLPDAFWPGGATHLELQATWTGPIRALSVQGSPHGELGWALESICEDIDRLFGRGDFEGPITLAG